MAVDQKIPKLDGAPTCHSVDPKRFVFARNATQCSMHVPKRLLNRRLSHDFELLFGDRIGLSRHPFARIGIRFKIIDVHQGVIGLGLCTNVRDLNIDKELLIPSTSGTVKSRRRREHNYTRCSDQQSAHNHPYSRCFGSHPTQLYNQHTTGILNHGFERLAIALISWMR